MTMSVGEVACVVRGRPVPARTALMIAVTITIMVVIRSTLIIRLRGSLAFDLPFARASVRNPQAVLADTPRAILDAGAVHAKWIGIAESSAALAKDRS